jgi:tetratricopeptide (TPR) repeat protein
MLKIKTRRGGRWVGLSLLMFALLWPAVSSARKSRAARGLARGVKYYEAARFKRSLKTLRRTLRRAKGAKLRAQLQLYVGLNESVLGRKQKAVAAFREALLADASVDLDPARFKPGDIALFEQAKRALKGRLRVEATRGEGALVLVDGKARGKAPLSLTMPVGRHDVVVRRGTDVQRREVVIAHGASETVSVTFAPLPPKKPDPVTKPVVVPERQIDKTPSPWSLSRPRLWTWVTLGLAVAAGGAALGVGLMAQSDAEEYRTTTDVTQLDSLADSANAKMITANVLAGVAGAAAIATVLLYYFEGRATPERERPLEAQSDVRLHVGVGSLRVVF